MLRDLSEKLKVKFGSFTLGFSVARFSCLDAAFSGILELQTSVVEGQQLPQTEKKRRNRKSEKKLKSSKILICEHTPNKNVVKYDAGRKVLFYVVNAVCGSLKQI